MSTRTQGTELYIFDPTTDDPLKVECITLATGFSGARNQLDDSCLEDVAASTLSGRVQPGTVTLGLNPDSVSPSQARLHELYLSGEKFKFALGWGDFTGGVAPGPVPTGVDSNGDPILPTTRSWLWGEASVSDFTFDFNPDDLVRSSITLQLSGLIEWIRKAP